MRITVTLIVFLVISFPVFSSPWKTQYIDASIEPNLVDPQLLHDRKIKIKYLDTGITFNSYGQYSILSDIEFYLEDGQTEHYLGKIDKAGVYGSTKNLLKQNPISGLQKNIGLSSEMIQDPFSLSVVVFINKRYGILDPYTLVRI